MKLRKNSYEKLNTRQRENYNFHHIAAEMAEYGFNTIRLSDDWRGADAIAIHINGRDSIKIQLKGRLAFDEKYRGKGMWVAFHDRYTGQSYLYNHDRLLRALPDVLRQVNKAGGRSMFRPSKEQYRALERYKL